MIRSQTYCFLTIYFFFCFFPLPNTFASPTPSLCRRNQRDVLLELQKELHVTATSWNKNVNCCSWDGVTCDANLGKVISLQLDILSTHNYSANISLKSSSSLFKLQHLRELDLSYWGLQGEIPSSIGNLSRLTSLDLLGNQFVGEVPASIGNLNQLEYIDLSDNHLRGNIPTSFANLTELSVLYLRGNQFTGGDIVLANLTSLSEIDLSSNHFKSSILPYLSGLHKFEGLLAYKNSFVGPFPSFLLMIPSLVYIDLGQNQFEGPIDFGNTSSSSSKLEVLNVGDNNLHGLIPKSISKLVSLRELNLKNNSLEGQVPYGLWNLPKIYSVVLSHNSLSSLGKSVEVVDGESLTKLDLGSNSLQGSFPQWICKFRHLVNLDLSNNHLTGSISQCLKKLTYLEKLNLRNNSLNGFLPDLFSNGSPLHSLDVSLNNLVGKLPKSLINCTRVEFLNVRGNKIKDMFPFWLGSLQSLRVLLLRSNALYGLVYNSSAYLGFPSLQIIDISNNNFVGSLPQDYFANWTEMSLVWNSIVPEWYYYGGNNKSDIVNVGPISYVFDSMDLVYKGVDTNSAQFFLDFKAIDFSGNRFSGHIPESIGLLSELRLLNLSGNTFTGNIPPSLANITKLETLDLSRNNLSGEIPQGLGKLTFLSNIDFSHNHLEGLVPQSTQFESQNCSSFVGNLGLHGLEKICGERHHDVPVPTSQQSEESLSEPEEPMLNWIAAAIAFGPGVFFGLVIGHIFTSYKHEWFIAR